MCIVKNVSFNPFLSIPKIRGTPEKKGISFGIPGIEVRL